MNIIPKQLQHNFLGVVYAFLVLAIWYLIIVLIERSASQGYIPPILVNNETLTPAGFVSHTLQFAAFFAAIRLLWPYKPIKLEIGRPVFVINLDKMTETNPYGECKVLSDFTDINDAADSNGDRTLVCYKDLSGNLDVINELVKLGESKSDLVSVVYPGMGKQDSEKRWASSWASIRRSFGCPTPLGDQFLSEPMRQGKLELLMWSLFTRYEYRPESEWGERKSNGYAMAYWNDERNTSCTLCEYYESKCDSDHEKTKVLWGIRGASKTLNIIRLKNTTHEVINDIRIHINRDGGLTNVIKKVSDVENMKVVSNTVFHTQILAPSIPPLSSRFIIVETGGEPIRENEISVETRLISKFGVKALRLIAVFSLLITSSIAAISYGQLKVHDAGNIKSVPASVTDKV